MGDPIQSFQNGQTRVQIYRSRQEAGRAAAAAAAQSMQEAISRQGLARIIVATGNSHLDTVSALSQWSGIEWRQVEVFHMDEYIGMAEDHPASFRRWIKERLAGLVHPGRVECLNGNAADLDEECKRYASLLLAAPIDTCLLGFGENGHLAFNDPPVVDFNDPQTVKRVRLDLACRRQQVGEGHFPGLDDVPEEALTLTIPALMRSTHLICSVPERRKAKAVKNAIEGPVTQACPASVVRTHPGATIFLDRESASLLGNFHPHD